jgi:general stress protein 26
MSQLTLQDVSKAISHIDTAMLSTTFVGSKNILAKRVFVAIEAVAELVRDKALFEQHWNKDIAEWADQGVNTPGLILIKAHAISIHYWDGRDEQELIV